MRFPSIFTLSPGPTASPSFATWPLMVRWPCAMRISMLRREPWPDCAMTFCRRSRFEGLLPPWRSWPAWPPPLPLPLPPRRRLPPPPPAPLALPGLAHSGTTPPGHSRRGALLFWRGGLSRMVGLRIFFGEEGLLHARGRGVGFRGGSHGFKRGLQLVQRRELLEGALVQIVQEAARRREERRAARRLAVADLVHP